MLGYISPGWKRRAAYLTAPGMPLGGLGFATLLSNLGPVASTRHLNTVHCLDMILGKPILHFAHVPSQAKDDGTRPLALPLPCPCESEPMAMTAGRVPGSGVWAPGLQRHTHSDEDFTESSRTPDPGSA